MVPESQEHSRAYCGPGSIVRDVLDSSPCQSPCLEIIRNALCWARTLWGAMHSVYVEPSVAAARKRPRSLPDYTAGHCRMAASESPDSRPGRESPSGAPRATAGAGARHGPTAAAASQAPVRPGTREEHAEAAGSRRGRVRLAPAPPGLRFPPRCARGQPLLSPLSPPLLEGGGRAAL